MDTDLQEEVPPLRSQRQASQKGMGSQVWQQVPVIPVLRRQTQEVCKLQGSLGYIASLLLGRPNIN